MGMDVSGTNPITSKGGYFRNNVWWWRPLWNYCCELYEPAQNVLGHTNDGDGLTRRQAEELAQILDEEVRSGRTKEYQEMYEAKQNSLPDEVCDLCEGTGKRKEAPQTGAGNVHCNGCDGKGKKRPFDTYYPFTVENVKEFSEFLHGCGGFEIW